MYRSIKNHKKSEVQKGLILMLWYSSIIKTKHYDWSEIKDFGLSYSGQVRGGGNTYDLYFSKKQQKTKNNCKKRLKGDVIKIFIFGDDYRVASEKVIPYCEKYATEPPFVGEDKYHFMW